MSIGNTTNICTICRNKGETNWYNISNHNQKNNQERLFSNPNNKIELCNSCHSKTMGKNLPPEREHIHDEESSTKQKLREGKAVAKQKSIHGRILAQKRNLERKDKQERITSRKRSL